MIPADFPALARTRLRLLRRRYGNGLTVVSLAIAVFVARVLGERLAGSGGAEAGERLVRGLPLAGVLFSLGVMLLAAPGARASLYSRPELEILLSQPVSAGALALQRLIETTVGVWLALAIVLAGVDAAFRAAGRPLDPLTMILVGLGHGAQLAAGALALGAVLQRTLTSPRATERWIVLPLLAIPPLMLVLLPVIGVGDQVGEALIRFLASPAGERTAAPFRVLLGEGGRVAGTFAATTLIAPLLAWVVARAGHAELRARSVGRPRTTQGRAGVLVRWLTVWLPRPVRALVRRDAWILLRGGFVRGWIVPAGLMVLPLLYRGFATDKALEPWSFELMSLLVLVMVGAAFGFLFGADMPRHLRPARVVEAAQPVRGRDALRARTFEAFVMSLPWLAAVLVQAGAVARPELRAVVPRLALGGVLLLGCLAAQSAAFGLRAERDRSGAEGSAFPLVVGFTGLMLALAARIFPLLPALYPWLDGGLGEQAARLYEAPEEEL